MYQKTIKADNVIFNLNTDDIWTHYPRQLRCLNQMNNGNFISLIKLQEIVRYTKVAMCRYWNDHLPAFILC